MTELFLPAIRRLGSFAAGAAVAYGATAETAMQVEIIIGALGAIGVDLVNSHRNRKKGK